MVVGVEMMGFSFEIFTIFRLDDGEKVQQS